MSGHTSGPWQLKTNRRGYPYQLVAPNGMNVKNVLRWAAFSVPALPEGQANASLIAAAPDLLAALKRAEQAIHSEYCSSKCHPECVAVTEAIAKAEGREHD